jgi:hypothetical protein
LKWKKKSRLTSQNVCSTRPTRTGLQGFSKNGVVFCRGFFYQMSSS